MHYYFFACQQSFFCFSKYSTLLERSIGIMIRNYKQNYKTNVKGFSYTGFENIKNFDSKLKDIGLCEDIVSNKGVVYLYLIKYLRVVTKDQLAELSDLLRREIHKDIKRLNELEKGSFLVNIESDDVDNARNTYYIMYLLVLLY